MEIAAAATYLRRALARTPETARAPLRLVPRSVMLSVEGDVKLLFYGAALDQALAAASPSALRESGGVALGLIRATSPAADAQAVAVLLGQMLTGRLTAAPMGNTPPPASMPKLPEALDHLVRSALAKDPAARPRDCDELRASLTAVLRDLAPDGLPRRRDRRLGSRRAGRGARRRSRAARRAGQARREAPGRRAERRHRRQGHHAHRVDDSGRTTRRRPGKLAGAPSGALPPGASGAIRAAARRSISDRGTVIPGTRYRILSKIGEGGMGSVYAAEHVDLEKKVAIKVLRADLAPDAETLQQFRQEARAASGIANIYICDVTDFGEISDGRVFFVMEYLDGVSLARMLRETPILEPGRVIAILRQVAKALGAAHEKGHRPPRRQAGQRDADPPRQARRRGQGGRLRHRGPDAPLRRGAGDRRHARVRRARARVRPRLRQPLRHLRPGRDRLRDARRARCRSTARTT